LKTESINAVLLILPSCFFVICVCFYFEAATCVFEEITKMLLCFVAQMAGNPDPLSFPRHAAEAKGKEKHEWDKRDGLPVNDEGRNSK
jgi:hypothetical protein